MMPLGGALLDIYGSHNDAYLASKQRYLEGLRAFLAELDLTRSRLKR